MEAALQKLELLIYHTKASPEMATRAFLDACRMYAEAYGFDLSTDYMAVHKAILPFSVDFDEETEHIIVHHGDMTSLSSVVFFRNSFPQSDFL